ncbi:unnamed protein product, partial [Durusdinium trenchii]
QVHYRCVLFGAAALRARNDWTLAIDMLDLMRCSGVDERASYHGVIKACRRVASTCKMWPALRVITGHIPKASSCQGIEGVSVLPKWWPISRMTGPGHWSCCDEDRRSRASVPRRLRTWVAWSEPPPSPKADSLEILGDVS